jgi:cell division protein FtsB
MIYVIDGNKKKEKAMIKQERKEKNALWITVKKTCLLVYFVLLQII